METSTVKLNVSRKLRRTGVRLGNTMATKGKQNMIIMLALLVLIAISMFATRKFRGDGERKVGAW